MKLTELITLLVAIVGLLLGGGWLTMFLVQLIKGESWPSWAKTVLGAIMAGIVGLAAAWTSGDIMHITSSWGHLTAADILAFGSVVYGISQVWYHKFFAGVAWMQKLGSFPVKKATP